MKEGLPVAGYTPQSQTNVDRVNRNKVMEERVLREIDDHAKNGDFDQRMVALARTKMQEAFMWLNRSVFRPERIDGDLSNR